MQYILYIALELITTFELVQQFLLRLQQILSLLHIMSERRGKVRLNEQSSLEQNIPVADLNDINEAIERWSDTILRLCRSRLRNLADAEDAFQDTFLALCRAKVAFQNTEHQKAWLLRCAINCCNQIMRKKSQYERKIHEYQERLATKHSTSHNPIEEIQTGCSSSIDPELEAALALLTSNQRTAVHLYYFEGYSTNEIASLTGEKPATVRSHLHRARQTLRLELSNERKVISCEKMISNADTMPCSEA